MIVVGGSVARSGEELIAGVREVIYRQSLPIATERLTIATSASGENAGVIGASIMALEAVLSSESVERWTGSAAAVDPA